MKQDLYLQKEKMLKIYMHIMTHHALIHLIIIDRRKLEDFICKMHRDCLKYKIAFNPHLWQQLKFLENAHGLF